MKKVILLVTLLGLFSSGVCGYKGSLKIQRIYIKSSRVMMKFDRSPGECTDDYYGIVAYLPIVDTPAFNAKLSLALTAKTTGQVVDIWYSGSGPCDKIDNLLKINGIGFSK